MSDQPRLFRIDPDQQIAETVEEVEFSERRLRERQDIQEWVAAYPEILDDDLLIIAKEYAGFDLTNERADLVAVDSEGNIVIIELKRDDTGSNAHWQAIKYASYFRSAAADEIVQLFADYKGLQASEAESRLKRHIEDDDLSNLNRRQRIILASHRFAPEVTSAVLWLNAQSAPDLITCVTLTPYRDQDKLYLQATTLLPISGTEGLQVGIGSSPKAPSGHGRRGKKEDAISHFMLEVYERATDRLEGDLKPDKKSRWAGLGGDHRYYYIWYSVPPLTRWKGMWLQIKLFGADESGKIKAVVHFTTEPKWSANFDLDEDHISDFLARVKDVQTELGDGFRLSVRDEAQAVLTLEAAVLGEDLTGAFREEVASSLVSLIMDLKPAIDSLAAEWD